MWKNLNSKKRFIVFVVVLFVVLLFGYFLGFRKTFELYHKNKELSLLVNTGEQELIQEISQLSRDKSRIDSLKNFYSGAESDAFLLKVLVKKANSYQIGVVGVDESVDRSGLVFEYTFEGGYRNLVRFLKDVETSVNSINLLSVVYLREENKRTKVISLKMKMLFNKNNYE